MPLITSKVWMLDESLNVIRSLQPLCKRHGYHCGLIGSVLNEGESYKDLDIVFLRLGKSDEDFDGLIEELAKYFQVDELEYLTEIEYDDNDREIYRVFWNYKQIDLVVML